MGADLGMRRLAIITALVTVAMGLTGCSSGEGSTPLYEQILGAARGAVAQNQARRSDAARPPLTRAALDQVEGSFIEVTLERTGQFAYLFESAKRSDGEPGRIVQWRTEDNVTLTLREGVLIATRGLGGGMVSSKVNVATGRMGPSSGGQKLHLIRTGEPGEARLNLICELQDLGAETVTIVERAHPARHLREDCAASGGTVSGGNGRGGDRVVNDYWVDSRAGIIWQSRQWGGPNIGYMRIRRLTY